MRGDQVGLRVTERQFAATLLMLPSWEEGAETAGYLAPSGHRCLAPCQHRMAARQQWVAGCLACEAETGLEAPDQATHRKTKQ